MVSERARDVFGRHSRYDVLLENYINKIAIEADLLQEMSRTYVLPAAYESINTLSETYRNLNDMGLTDQAQSMVDEVSPLTDLTVDLHNGLSQLMEAKEDADRLSDAPEIAQAGRPGRLGPGTSSQDL